MVGTDGSETAAEAVSKAIELAKLTGATLSLVSAYAPVSGRRVSGEQ
ncbi:MAG TPA: universal stress protein, partial [Solirubrobacterales bacterium]|nr:universal stress protein [Solirubrobacterales bacterium]